MSNRELPEDLRKMTKEEIKAINDERAEFYHKYYINEYPALTPLINEIRFCHGYMYIRPFLIHAQTGDKYELYEYVSEKRVRLAFIDVLPDRQRKGNGTKMMELLTTICDKYGYSIDLEITPKFGVGKDVLVKFYKKFGFVKDGRYGDGYIRRSSQNK